jgi:hypothetical protein
MIRSILLGIVITAALASTASAQNKLVYGAGMISCGEWQQYRSTGNKPANLQAQAWIDGYLSGANAEGTDIDFLTPKPSTVAYYAWIDNYCGQHPLDAIVQAVSRLKDELVSRAK